MKDLQNERFTYVDMRSGRTPRAYVQDVLRYVRAAEYSSTYYQLFNV